MLPFLYSNSCTSQEDLKTPIYGCAFRPESADKNFKIFVIVGGNRVSIYKCEEDDSIGKKSVNLLQVFEDPNVSFSLALYRVYLAKHDQLVGGPHHGCAHNVVLTSKHSFRCELIWLRSYHC